MKKHNEFYLIINILLIIFKYINNLKVSYLIIRYNLNNSFITFKDFQSESNKIQKLKLK